MSLTGKRVAISPIKSDIDLFSELWRYKPDQIKHLTPNKVHACILHEGEFGSTGTLISWHYFHDDKDRVAKQIITDINEEKKLISYKMIEGDLLELYKTMQITLQVDTNGEDNLVTWTVEYEKLNESVPDPDTLMEFFTNMTKDIVAAHLKISK